MEVNNNEIKTKQENKKNLNNKIGFHKTSFLREALTFVIACFSYINGLTGDFVHDDVYAIQNNKDVTGQNPISSLVLNDFWGKSMWSNASHKSYRPLTILTFRLQYSVYGSNTFPYHVVNVLLHAAVTSLFTWTCRRSLQLPPTLATVAGLVFAVHPIHVEAVTGLVGRAELLSALLFLLSFIFYTNSLLLKDHLGLFPSTRDWRWYIISLLLGAAAMLCKEQGIMVLPVCILFDVYICCRRGIHRSLKERSYHGCFALFQRLCITSLFICSLMLFRWWMMNGHLPSFLHQDNPASFSPSLVTRCLSYAYIWTYNLYLLLFPNLLCYDWQVGSIPLVEGFADTRNLATLAISFISIIAFLHWIRTFKEQQTPHQPDVVSMVFLFSILPFVPASNLLFRVGFVIAERTLYIPSMGYCILVAAGFYEIQEKFPTLRKHITCSFIFLLITFMCKTWTQNKVWDTRESLFLSGVKALPQNAKVHYNYANILKDMGHTEKAIEEYRISIRIYPDYPSAHNNLGTLLSNTSEAMQHFQLALNIMPGHPGALINLGARIFKEGNKTDGVAMLQKALKIDPLNVEGLMTLGGMMAELNEWDTAEALFREAITEKPDFAEAYHNYGTYLHLKGDIQTAVHFYQKAFSLDNHKTVSMVNAARGLRQLGMLDEALSVLDRALIYDRSTDVLDMLGLVYYQMGRLDDSVSLYQELETTNPNNTDVTTHFAQVLANSGEMKRAKEMLMHVITHEPDHKEALHFLANVLGKMGNHLEALVYLERAIKLQLKQDDQTVLENMYFQQGNHYKDIKQYEAALKSYEKSVTLQPTNIKSHVNIGAIYHIKGDLGKAKYHYSTVLKLDPDNRIAFQNLQKLQNIQGQSQVKKQRT